MKIKTDTVIIELETQAERDAVKQLIAFAKDNMPATGLGNALAASIITALEQAPLDN
jgi:hypothetical protein